MLLLATWSLVVVLLALPALAAGAWLARRHVQDERVRVIAPLVFTGVLGYAVFFGFFLNPVLGRTLSLFIEVGCGVYVMQSRRELIPGMASSPLLVPALLGFAIGLFYLALLYLPELGRTAEWQSSVRFLYDFPMDANLPKMLGDRLYEGASLKPFLPEAGWLSSDRPPLQVGLYLLIRPWTGLLRIPEGLAYQCLGTLAQLAWLPAAWLLGHALRLGARRSALVIVLAAASGFLLFNGTYVWPKLLAGGFVLLAAIPLLDRSTPRSAALTGLAAGAAALGWLAHGAAAFSLVTLALVLLLPRGFPGWRQCLGAAAVFALLALPWTAYQKFYDPPANRLLKWHLAGVIPIDSRGTLEAIRDSYRALPRAALVANKEANLGTLFNTTNATILDPFTGPARQRRVDEFFYVFRSLGILNLAWIAAPLTWLWRRRLPPRFGLTGLLLGWTALTLVFWALALFLPASTIVHSSSYAMMLGLFLLAIVLILDLPAALAWALLGWHLLDFALTWLPYYGSAPLHGEMIFLLGFSIALIALALKLAPRAARAGKSAGKAAATPLG